MPVRPSNQRGPPPSSALIPHSSSRKPRESKFDHLDAAAKALTDVLRVARISHSFIGGYAATLLGGNRLTQDVDVLVDRQCFDTLLSSSVFTKTPDGRLAFHYMGKEVPIDLHVGVGHNARDSCWNFIKPKDGSEDQLTINGGDMQARPILYEDSTKIAVLQPVFLLYTKLLAWAKSELSTRKEKNDLNEVNMEDVITILNWLQRKRILIELHGWSIKTRERYLWL
ncbi:hypothetical protein N7456_000952 [Penicillium angulare]|uniref:Uncharacterized protein n=1 Tax=Penicillium angulare TaxID=116970 RepID=A0A9W9GD43_9EURO|nr:hypothetical protein N7456_000952 [Penicillium angulare]